jgi:hypothetical protein
VSRKTSGDSKSSLTKSQSELIAYLFDAQPNPILVPLRSWVASSPRYAKFVEKYKDKIRKKIRVTREKDALADLLHELQIPYWLLQEKRFEVAYESYAVEKTRSPDFSVTFRSNFIFNIEVTHLRGLQGASAPIKREDNPIDYRLVDVLCNKLRQTLPNMANLLFIVAAGSTLKPPDLAAHLTWIMDKAERSDPDFYARHRFLNASDFFKYYDRLSGLTLYNSAGVEGHALWLNPRSRVKLPGPVRNILHRGLGG